MANPDKKYVILTNFVDQDSPKENGEHIDWKRGEIYTGSRTAELLKEGLIAPAKTKLEPTVQDLEEGQSIHANDGELEVSNEKDEESEEAPADGEEEVEDAPKKKKGRK